MGAWPQACSWKGTNQNIPRRDFKCGGNWDYILKLQDADSTSTPEEISARSLEYIKSFQ